MNHFIPGCQARVILHYQSQYPDPIVMRKGEVLITGRKDAQYPGWIWCTTAGGKSGWVPESYLTCHTNQGVALENYDAREMTVEVDEELLLMQVESGWYRAQKPDGQTGWIPAECIQLL